MHESDKILKENRGIVLLETLFYVETFFVTGHRSQPLAQKVDVL